MEIMDELVEAFLNGNEDFPYFLNIKTKEILIDFSDVDTDGAEIDWENDEVADFLVAIPQMKSPEAYDLMLEFAKQQEVKVSQQLIETLNGRKPFRSFKNQIKGLEIERAWYDFENDYAKKEMSAWIDCYL